MGKHGNKFKQGHGVASNPVTNAGKENLLALIEGVEWSETRIHVGGVPALVIRLKEEVATNRRSKLVNTLGGILKECSNDAEQFRHYPYSTRPFGEADANYDDPNYGNPRVITIPLTYDAQSSLKSVPHPTENRIIGGEENTLNVINQKIDAARARLPDSGTPG